MTAPRVDPTAEARALIDSDPDGAARELVRLRADRDRWRDAVHDSADALEVDRLRGNVEIAETCAQAARAHETEAQQEAYRYRRLWECAAGVLRRTNVRPDGADERRMLAAAGRAFGPVGEGSDGWLNWLPDPAAPEGAVTASTLFGEAS